MEKMFQTTNQQKIIANLRYPANNYVLSWLVDNPIHSAQRTLANFQALDHVCGNMKPETASNVQKMAYFQRTVRWECNW